MFGRGIRLSTSRSAPSPSTAGVQTPNSRRYPPHPPKPWHRNARRFPSRSWSGAKKTSLNARFIDFRPEKGLKQNEVVGIQKKLRGLCLTFVILMLLSVSVHPAMAQMDVKEKIERTNAAASQVRVAMGCPGCASGITPATAGQYLNRSNLSVHIREIELDSGISGRTVANARTISLPMGTLEVQAQGTAGAAPAADSSGREAEIIADYDNDPAVKAYIHNVTAVMGFAERTGAGVKHYSAGITGINASQDIRGVFEVVTYTYTNVTTRNRFRFVATQTIDGNGKAVPPIIVLPGQEFPPEAEQKNPDAECWYWYLLIGIAVLAVIAAITATIAVSAAGSSGSSHAFSTKMKQLFRDGAAYRDPHRNVQDIRIEEIHEIYGGKSSEPDEQSTRRFVEWLSNQGERSDAYNQKIWTTSVFIAIIVFIVLIGIMFPLVSAALVFLAAAVIGLLVCKGLVEDENARAQLEEMLNPETLAGFSEKDNGQRIIVPSTRRTHVVIVLPETTEDGVPYTWNAGADPATTALSLVVPDPDNPDMKYRTFLFFTPLNQTMQFSARYVPAYGLPGMEKKTYNVTFAPLVWQLPQEVDNSSRWVGYGTSLAIDKKTDRMHISYLDYSGTWGDAGKLIYRSGEGTAWDPPLVVDDTISWTTGDNNEMARYTSIALDPDGNPQISYMDWRTGHLKFARKVIPEKDAYTMREGVTVHDGWFYETVDDSSSYAGWGSSIAVDREGNPHISYLVQEQGFFSPPTLKYARWTRFGWEKETLARNLVGHNDGKFWAVNVQDGAITSIALDSQDHPHISYIDANHDPARSMTCSGEVCTRNYQLMHTSWNGTAWNTEPVDQEYNPGSYTRHGLYSSIAIDPRDLPHISYFSIWDNACTDLAGVPIGQGPLCDYFLYGKLKYASFNGSAWSTETVDSSTTSVGLYSSLKIDSRGNPHISYMDWKNGFLRYATSSGGSYWFRSVPDRQNSDTGRFSSIAIDSRGYPRIVYMDYRNGHVKYVFGTFPELDKKTMTITAPGSGASADTVTMQGDGGQEMIGMVPFP